LALNFLTKEYWRKSCLINVDEIETMGQFHQPCGTQRRAQSTAAPQVGQLIFYWIFALWGSTRVKSAR